MDRRRRPAVRPHLAEVAADTLGDLRDGPIPPDTAARGTVDVEAGTVTLALRRQANGR